MGKYLALWEHVQKDGRTSMKFSFDEINAIAGIAIDHSFLNYKKELTQYGYQVGKISLKEKTVEFIKINMDLHYGALIVIDMQEDYIGEKSKYGYNAPLLIDRINERIEKAKQNHEIIIYIKNKRMLKSGTLCSELVKGLSVLSDHIFYKEKSSVFSNNEILDLLRLHDIKQIEVVGIDGNCCVASSAVEAAKLGFATQYPVKYIGIKNTRLFTKTSERLMKANVQIIEE